MHSAHELLIASFVLGGVGKPISVKMWSTGAGHYRSDDHCGFNVLIGVAVLTFASVTLTQALTKRRTT